MSFLPSPVCHTVWRSCTRHELADFFHNVQRDERGGRCSRMVMVLFLFLLLPQCVYILLIEDGWVFCEAFDQGL